MVRAAENTFFQDVDTREAAALKHSKHVNCTGSAATVWRKKSRAALCVL